MMDFRRKDARRSASALVESETLADDMKMVESGVERILEERWRAIENGGYQWVMGW